MTAAGESLELPVLKPDLQVTFYYRLQNLRDLYLQDALKQTVQSLVLSELDDELTEYVNEPVLTEVAAHGIRGEVFFPVPLLLTNNPYLLGYYRLLYGLSQKEFYAKGPFGRFKKLEGEGNLLDHRRQEIPTLCRSLVQTGQMLVQGLDTLSPAIAHDLQLLTIGPQLRGSENTRLGKTATREVFELVRSLVSDYIEDQTKRTIRLKNDSGRTVLIEFSSDPDIRITENLPSGVRRLVSIEIKGGTDYSNIHNRLGEAEKSHLKARERGFHEFWTILRVKIDEKRAKQGSPTSNKFFHLDHIGSPSHKEAKKFRELLCSLISIRI